MKIVIKPTIAQRTCCVFVSTGLVSQNLQGCEGCEEEGNFLAKFASCESLKFCSQISASGDPVSTAVCCILWSLGPAGQCRHQSSCLASTQAAQSGLVCLSAQLVFEFEYLVFLPLHWFRIQKGTRILDFRCYEFAAPLSPASHSGLFPT